MKDIVWSATLSVEVREIDDDHQKLVDLFNMLNHAVTGGESADYIGAILEELISCTAWHFTHEERLMVKYGYEGLQEHKAEHAELVETARALQQERRQEGKPVSEEDIAFMEHWLTSHILTSDMQMGAFLYQKM